MDFSITNLLELCSKIPYVSTGNLAATVPSIVELYNDRYIEKKFGKLQ